MKTRALGASKSPPARLRNATWAWWGLWALFLALGWLFTPWIARASPTTRKVQVPLRQVLYVVQPNGDVRVYETWRVRFSASSAEEPFTYAFREIPRYRVSAIEDWEVWEGGRRFVLSESGTPYTFQVSRSPKRIVVAWHFPPTFGEKERTFTLRYTLKEALWLDPQGDQFFWKVVEPQHGYDIDAVRAAVVLPEEVSSEVLRWATYWDGSEWTAEDTVRVTSLPQATLVSLATTGIYQDTAWEVRLQWPHGFVQAQPPAWQRQEQRKPWINLLGLALGWLLGIGGPLFGLGLWLWRGRVTPWPHPAQEPPDKRPLGLVSLLFTHQIGAREFTATLIDLARRGFMRFEQVEVASYTGKRERQTVLRRLRPGEGDELQPFERLLLQTTFAGGEERELAQLGQAIHPYRGRFRRQFEEAALASGWFTRLPWTNPRAAWLTVGLGLPWALSGWMLRQWADAPVGLWVLWGGLAAALGTAIVLAWRWPPLTAQGREALARWKAYRRYLQRLQRFKGDEARQAFEKRFPELVALGLSDAWREYAPGEEEGSLTATAPSPSSTTTAPAWSWFVVRPPGMERGVSSSTGRTAAVAAAGNPSVLNTVADNAIESLNDLSDRLFATLDAVSTSFNWTAPPSPSSSSGGSLSSQSTSSHASPSPSRSPWSSGDGGGSGGGGGSSGFG